LGAALTADASTGAAVDDALEAADSASRWTPLPCAGAPPEAALGSGVVGGVPADCPSGRRATWASDGTAGVSPDDGDTASGAGASAAVAVRGLCPTSGAAVDGSLVGTDAGAGELVAAAVRGVGTCCGAAEMRGDGDAAGVESGAR
jgi:hypothetical protein